MAGNTFSAFRTLRPGVAWVDAQLQDFAFPAHSHEHVCVGLMLDGEKSSRYGLRRHTVRRGDVLLVNPGEVHDGRPSGWCGRRYSMLEIDPATFRRICFDAIGRDWVEFQQPVLRDLEVRRALSAWLTSLKGTDAFAEREASTMLLGLVSANGDGQRGQSAAGGLAAKISLRMRENLADADSIGDLAMETGASRYQLIRAFKQSFDLTPEDFRRQLRVERARSLLASSQRLADVAAEAGFADQSHMTREFRRLVGLTPGAYRRAMQ
jgi:AraC-like DNA-binding protein